MIVPIRIGEPAGGVDDDCVPHEAWLVTQEAGAFAVVQLLAKDCSREPTWPVEVKVSGDSATLDLGGELVPSNWTGTESVSFELSPPRFVRKEGDYYFRVDPCPTEKRFREVGGFAGEIVWRRTAGGETCTPEHAYVPVPVATLPPDFERDVWRTTALGDCATQIDGAATPGHGYTLSGATSGPADAAVIVVLSETGVLYVELGDDQFTTKTPRPEDADHVLLFTSRESDGYMSMAGRVPPKPSRWSVDVASGRVFGAVNAPGPALEVARAEDRGRVRLRVRFPRRSIQELLDGGIAVAYSDADDGGTAVVATSHARAGDGSSLGGFARVDPDVTCRVHDGSLARAVEPRSRETALYPRER